jgi:hypothetical protein
MTNPQGMDKLFWGRNHEDVNDWAKTLTITTKFWDFNANKLFKIAKLNLKGRAKKWFKKLNLAPTDWRKLHTWIV